MARTSTAPIGFVSLGGSIFMVASMRAIQACSFSLAQHEGHNEVARLHDACHVILSLVELEHTVLTSMPRPPWRRMARWQLPRYRSPVRVRKLDGAPSAKAVAT
jgi:hypothetical protein